MNATARGPWSALLWLLLWSLAGCGAVYSDEPATRAGGRPQPRPVAAATAVPPAPAAVAPALPSTPAPAPPPTPFAADLGRAADDEDTTCADFATEPIRWGVLILGSEKELAAAEEKARTISAQTKVPFSREGYALHPKTGKPVFKRWYEGQYYPRTEQCKTNTRECITIEHSSGYARFAPELYIIVGGVLAEQEPDSFAKYRAVVPDAYVKYSPVTGDDGGYGGTSACMEWDVIVLGRTKTFAEAEAIAREASTRTGIPYVPRPPATADNDYYSLREKPYPQISIESDNAYGERDQSPYFLVVGGEIGLEDGATPALFDRFRKAVPGAYRMKRARHVCGQ